MSEAAAAAAEEEEVRMEVEAVRAVYGEDCRVVIDFPPHLHVHIAPRTADDSSQQFVEVILGIQCDAQYPMKLPHVHIVESKGLDENRQVHLLKNLENKAHELSSCLMLVALCEEAVELLSNMNHPEGDCPMCLYPLALDDGISTSLPFMKLMSCYHCFHSECIIRWWKWLQEQNSSTEVNWGGPAISSSVGNDRGLDTSINEQQHNCPVCRKTFVAKDIEHVLGYLEQNTSQLNTEEMDLGEDLRMLLLSDLENNRRQKFETLLNVQQEKSGLIEPRKEIVVLPGMYLLTPTTPSARFVDEQSSCTSINTTADVDSNISLKNASTSKPKTMNSGRKDRPHSSGRQKNTHGSRKQWIKKETSSSEK